MASNPITSWQIPAPLRCPAPFPSTPVSFLPEPSPPLAEAWAHGFDAARKLLGVWVTQGKFADPGVRPGPRKPWALRLSLKEAEFNVHFSAGFSLVARSGCLIASVAAALCERPVLPSGPLCWVEGPRPSTALNWGRMGGFPCPRGARG